MNPKRGTGNPEHHLLAGDYFASREPAVIYTLLGSCVAACLFDPLERVGGMNHILLPGKADLAHFDASARYGINAMELLINRIMVLGGKRRNFAAKVFGGAHIIPTISLENGVGWKNAEFVLEFLRMENIRVISSDLGGTRGRKIYFNTDTGEVFLHRIRAIGYPDIGIREKKMLEKSRMDAMKPAPVIFFKCDPE